MNKKVYVCTGGCEAEITEKQFKKGLTKCGAEDCNRKGDPFEEREKCENCQAIFSSSESHFH